MQPVLQLYDIEANGRAHVLSVLHGRDATASKATIRSRHSGESGRLLTDDHSCCPLVAGAIRPNDGLYVFIRILVTFSLVTEVFYRNITESQLT